MNKFSSLPHSSLSTTHVRFNVGGRIYRVSKSLLEQHPDTMLARLASDTRCPANESSSSVSPDRTTQRERHGSSNEASGDGKDDGDDATTSNTVFIERNGERFQYCLDYMRDGGNVVLPPTIPKKVLLQDLEYYGFRDVDPSGISVVGPAPMLKTCLDAIDSLRTDLEDERKILELARFCLDSYKTNGLPFFIVSMGLKRKELFETAHKLVVQRDQKSVQRFDACLGRIGLTYFTGGDGNYNGSEIVFFAVRSHDNSMTLPTVTEEILDKLLAF